MQQPPYGQPPQQQPPEGGWQQPPYNQPPQQQPPPGGGWQQGPGDDGFEPPPERNWWLIGGIAGVGSICFIFVVALVCILALAGGGDGNDEEPTAVSDIGGPTVTISSPTSGQTFNVGDTITMQAQAVDVGGGVTRVELLVNNVVVDSQTSQEPTGEENLAVLLDYVAAVPTPNLTLTVRAYRGVQAGDDATVTVAIGSGTSPTATTQSGSNTTQQTVPTAAVFNPTCRARVDIGTLNFRAGPSTDYNILGVLNLGAEVNLIGRLGDNSWWQVTNGVGSGWVSAAYTTLLGNCGNVPVTAAPTPQATSTSPPTAVPQQANLVVSTLTGSNSIVLTGGEVLASYILRVKNEGSTDAGAFNVTITYPNGDVFDFTVASLAAGQETEIPDVTATFSTPGTYRLTVFVDSSGNITESDKNDNLAFLDITVLDPTPTPEGG